MKQPLVTIITPTFNHEGYIAECIDSVLAQGYPEWEQIVVDDGSTDRTAEIVRSYSDPRIHYIRLQHRGLGSLSETYNTALARARGTLVAVLEGDDRWPAGKLERQVPLFDDPSVFLSWGRARLIDRDGAPRGERVSVVTRQATRSFTNREVFQRLATVNLLTPTVTVVVRRDALEAAGGFQQSGSTLFVDLPTWLAVSARAEGVAVYLNAVVGCYRVHGEQTSSRFVHRMESEHLQVVLEQAARLEPRVLAALGWEDGVRRRAVVGGLLAAGRGHLHTRRFGSAAGSFGRALARSRSLPEAGKSVIGLLSTVVRRDLLGSAYASRERAVSLVGRSAAESGPEVPEPS